MEIQRVESRTVQPLCTNKSNVHSTVHKIDGLSNACKTPETNTMEQIHSCATPWYFQSSRYSEDAPSKICANFISVRAFKELCEFHFCASFQYCSLDVLFERKESSCCTIQEPLYHWNLTLIFNTLQISIA